MRTTRRALLWAAASVALPGGGRAQGSAHKGVRTGKDYLALVRSHIENIIHKGTDVYGPIRTPMWMASLDTRTKAYPENAPKAAVGLRAYREICAPRGSSIYWDQPQMVAAHAMSRLTGDNRFSAAVDDYVRAFLERGIDENGLFEWGNHRYYDAYTDKVVRFEGGPHEMRPVIPAWEVFWRISPQATERQIRQSGIRHVFDDKTGGFNRHDDSKPSCAFLESGGILAESLCWLARKVGDPTLTQRGLRIARFSFSHRGADTGLVENNPTVTRWDKYVSTTEVGLWAGSLLRAASLSNENEFARMADQAVTQWLRYGYDPKTRQYYGQIRVKDGKPELSQKAVPGPTEYWPGIYANIWNANFPTHDYPMAMAETCLELYRRTKAPRFAEAVERWAGVVIGHPAPKTAKDGRGAYAELFGRAIHFLTGAAQTFRNRRYGTWAHKLAEEAVETLYTNGMFRSHAGEDRYDAIDGVGYLALSLIYLQTGKKPDYMGFGF